MKSSFSAVQPLKKMVVCAAALASGGALAVPAHAETFDFTFVAPLTNGDVASGSGQVNTAQADASGRYLIRSVRGMFVGYEGERDVRPIAGAKGYDADFVFADAFLVSDASGVLSAPNIAFFDRFPFDGIGFERRSDGKYDGFFSEVGVRGATLTFAPAVSGVPEPATWAMLIVGFGMIGLTARLAVRRSEIKFDAKIKRITAGLES